MRSSRPSRRSPCRKASRRRACIGPSRASSPRCSTAASRRTRSCGTPRSRDCARTRARRRSCTIRRNWGRPPTRNRGGELRSRGRVRLRGRRRRRSPGTGTGTYTYIKDLAGLIAMVQMGVLEIHPWGSTVKKLETPDIVTFDFDPDIGLPWERVTEAALEMREALLGIGLRSFAKTTGGKGLHVVVPLTPKLDWDTIKEFAKWVAERFVKTYPDRFTSDRPKRARTGRIFIDYLRNGRVGAQNGAYPGRARPGARVATH